VFRVSLSWVERETSFKGRSFIVLGTQKSDRNSWIVCHEDGKYPNVIVEILSDSTAAVDKGLKKQIYQDTFRTPDYFWFDPVTLKFQGFHLVEGKYQPIPPTTEGKLWSQQLELYLGVYESKLRYFTDAN
jgi:Uma2 family endonuclease